MLAGRKMTEITTDVGSTKVYEDDKIVVWNFELQPGETTPVHKNENLTSGTSSMALPWTVKMKMEKTWA